MRSDHNPGQQEREMSDSVLPRFNHPVHVAMIANIQGLRELRKDREFLARSLSYMLESLVWTQSVIRHEEASLARDVAAGRKADTAHLRFNLGVEIVKKSHILACERLLAGL